MQQMFMRRLEERIRVLHSAFPAVLLTGARQTGKTTLARHMAGSRPSVVFDLDQQDHQDELRNPFRALEPHQGKLIIIDEVQRVPGLFHGLRAAIDHTVMEGSADTRFILTGSVAGDLQRQTESLPGRLADERLHGIDLLELDEQSDMQKLWSRGGYPKSYLADNEKISKLWRKKYLNRELALDLANMGARLAPDLLRQLLVLLADDQGTTVNMSRLARALQCSQPTVKNYIKILEGMMLVSSLPALSDKFIDDIVRKAKYYICDSGLHGELTDMSMRLKQDSMRSRSARGTSWEGFALENIRSVMPEDWKLSYLRTLDGQAEMDLVIEKLDGKIWAVEFKVSALRLEKGNVAAKEMLKPERTFLVHAGDRTFARNSEVEVTSLRNFMKELVAHSDHEITP